MPRERAVSIPVTRAGEELPQVLLDLRSARAYSWKEAIVLYDGTMTRDMVTRVITSLTGHTSLADVTAAGMALAVMKLEAVSTEAERIHEATSTLSDLPHRQLGSNFIVIVSSVYVEPILQAARALEMLHPASQWLFAVADTDTRLTGMDQHINLLKEGDNIAFVYNWTSNEGLTCTTSVLCHGEELLEAFCTALDAAVQEETTMAGQLSEEEWETVRPAKADRRDFLLRDINVRHLSGPIGHISCSVGDFLIINHLFRNTFGIDKRKNVYYDVTIYKTRKLTHFPTSYKVSSGVIVFGRRVAKLDAEIEKAHIFAFVWPRNMHHRISR